jgi:lipoprotein signal peptidase
LPWKGVALWRAAINNHKGWFVALLLLNTLAILEIIYIFVFSKKSNKNYEK